MSTEWSSSEAMDGKTNSPSFEVSRELNFRRFYRQVYACAMEHLNCTWNVALVDDQSVNSDVTEERMVCVTSVKGSN